jgi:hypothetical protein
LLICEGRAWRSNNVAETEKLPAGSYTRNELLTQGYGAVPATSSTPTIHVDPGGVVRPDVDKQ